MELPALERFTREDLQDSALIFISYLGVYLLVAKIIPPSVVFTPYTGIALGGLFFTRWRFWPVIAAASLVGSVFSHTTIAHAFLAAASESLVAALGAYLLRSAQVDPLFRRSRDAFNFLSTIIAISAISPTFEVFGALWLNLPYSFTLWWQSYVATFACLLVVTPFILRWVTKSRFQRTLAEGAETVVIFLVLIGCNLLAFTYRVPSVFGFGSVAFLLIPLFWISLRLRPRFTTLALLITGGLVIASVLGSGTPDLAMAFFRAETFLITLGVSFFVIVSLAEDLRVTTNLMKSQLSTLQNAVARVSSESKAKNDFIAILAHELRNPLAPIVSAIDLLKLRGQRSEEDVKTLDMMEERMRTVRRLLDDLLDISRIAEGKVALKREQVDVVQIVRRAILSTNHHREERHQSLAFKPPSAPLFVEGDPVRLEQIFSNLLTNASKYSSSGDTITLRAGEEDGFARIEVADEGVGIAPEALQEIFVPFYQIEQGETTKQGLGIGLTLVRSFVEMHGGSVRAESEGINTGSRFIVRLPLAAGGEKSKRAFVPSLFAPHTEGPSILIVDDNDAAAAGIGRLLELHGSSVGYAYDGRQALAVASGMGPDIILLDIGLPDQDGYAVAKALRKQGFKGRLIAVTGYSGEEVESKGKKAGFDAYLVKPVGLSELRRVMPELG